MIPLMPLWFGLILSVLFAALFFCMFKALQALSRPAQEKVTQEEKVYVPQYSAEDIKAGLELCKSILEIHEKQRQEEIDAKKEVEDPKMAEYALKEDRIEDEKAKYTIGNGTKIWKNKEGFTHREDGPAIEHADGSKSWCINGQYHREDGPAIERSDGTKEWYLYGTKYTEEQCKCPF